MNKEKIIRNNLEIQEKLSKTLLKNHCLGAFIVLLDSGRELELEYNKISFSITRHEEKLFMNIEESQSYNNAYELLLHAKIDNQYLIDIWDNTKIIVLF